MQRCVEKNDTYSYWSFSKQFSALDTTSFTTSMAFPHEIEAEIKSYSVHPDGKCVRRVVEAVDAIVMSPRGHTACFMYTASGIPVLAWVDAERDDPWSRAVITIFPWSWTLPVPRLVKLLSSMHIATNASQGFSPTEYTIMVLPTTSTAAPSEATVLNTLDLSAIRPDLPLQVSFLLKNEYTGAVFSDVERQRIIGYAVASAIKGRSKKLRMDLTASDSTISTVWFE